MLSFDITDRNIRIIKGSENNGKIRINSAATLNLAEEVIVNGHVRDVAKLATMINQVLRTNKMIDKDAIVSISSNMTIFKELHIQKTAKEQEFMKMVRAEMQAALGIDESYSVSYIIVGDSDQQENALKILATACPYEVVDSYKRVFNMLNIPLRSVMIGCNCITKVLLADTKVKAKMPLLAVQIDNNFISLNLYEKGQLSFSRFASISAEDYDDSADYVFEAVNENVFRMLQFQKSKPDSDMIENVIFYGDTHEYVRLTNELEKMNIRTSTINAPPQIHGIENVEFATYANAIGAMFKRNKETEHINLLETDTVNNNKIKSDSSYVILLLAIVGICLVLVLGVFAVLKIRNGVIRSDIKEINEKQESEYCQQLKAQLETLTALNTQVSSYYTNLEAANGAYISRPYLSKESYNKIENTIYDVVKEVYANKDIKYSGQADTDDVNDEKTIRKLVDIVNLSYVDGVYTFGLSVNMQDIPWQIYPAKLMEAFKKNPEVYNVSYSGWSVGEAEMIGIQKETKQTVDEDGNVIEEKTNEKKVAESVPAVNFTFDVIMKGDDMQDYLGVKDNGTEAEVAK